MWKVIFRRLLLMIPQLLALSVLIFVMAELMPGDPLTGLVDPKISAEQIEAMRVKLGLNQPLWKRYIDWMVGMFHGDFGRSFAHKQPVTAIIAQRIWPTVWLSLFTTIITYMIALPLGILSGRYSGGWFDKVVNFYNFLTFSIPSFVLGLFFLWLFGYTLGWFPTRGTVGAGLQPGTLDYVLSRIYHMILPAFTLAVLSTTSTIQWLRSGIVDAKADDYVRTARAKGVPERVVYNKHILRNALLPIAAFFGYELTRLFGGAMITEQIFTYQGMGQLFITSVSGRDYSVMITLVLFYGFLTLLGGLLSDIIMVFVDPRVRLD